VCFCWELLWKYEIASLVLAFAAFGTFCFLLFTGVVCVANNIPVGLGLLDRHRSRRNIDLGHFASLSPEMAYLNQTRSRSH
jgi:hypothetical protein